MYGAGTLTPANTYQDTGLTKINPFPLVGDAAGRIPVFWVADGSYRARLTDALGGLLYDSDGILSIGPSSGGGGGGGGGSTVATNGFQTGDMLWSPIQGTRVGWVRANAKTIGSAASGATERANGDSQNLFTFLWSTFSNTTCPVSGGRGASAVADWTSNKTIGLLDMRGRAPFGLDDMGNVPAGTISGGTIAFTQGGAANSTIAQVNLPAVNLSGSSLVATVTDPGHSHNVSNVQGSFNVTTGSGGQGNASRATSTNTTGITVAISGSVPLGGSGTAFGTISPYSLGTWFISL